MPPARLVQRGEQIDQRLIALLAEIRARGPIGPDADLAGEMQAVIDNGNRERLY